MNRVVVGVGSNISPEDNIRAARDTIATEQSLLSESKFVTTKPIGLTDQPDFLNGAFLVETDMTREDFTGFLKDLEKRQGRKKSPERFGPRTIDLDIVVWNGEVVDPDYHDRDFLRKSVAEVLSVEV